MSDNLHRGEPQPATSSSRLGPTRRSSSGIPAIATVTHLGLRLLFLSVVLLSSVGACEMKGHGGQGPAPALPEFSPREPNDEYYQAEQWNMQLIEMPDAWGVLTSSEVSRRTHVVYVAVLDTAIDMTHPDLKANLVEGWDFVENRPIAPGSNASGTGTTHGTHVAGIIAATTNNETGVTGIGWNRIRVIPVRVLDNNDKGSGLDLANGILYAAGLANSSGNTPARRADVINMSLGREDGQPLGSAVDETLTRAADRGITLVASSGNNGSDPNGVIYPAAYPNVIAVGSVNPPESEEGEPTRSAYSDYGMGLEFVAPGGRGLGTDRYAGVYSTVENGGYGNEAGTSMAAPHVSGLAALLYSVADSMTQNGVRSILRQTATAIAVDESYPHPEFGYGLVHAGRAIRRALMQPYGPYRRDDEITLQSAPSKTESTYATKQHHTLTAAVEEHSHPKPGTYRPDRLIVSFDEEWLNSAPPQERQARLEAIAAAHRLVSISGGYQRYGVADLSPDQDATELRAVLLTEAEIAAVGYDFYVFAQ